MDIDMPVMDGITATKEIRSFEKLNNILPVKILGVTGHDVKKGGEIYKIAGMNLCINKPLTLEFLS